MTLAASLAFLICFVIGPLLCAALMRLPPLLSILIPLGVLAGGSAFAGLRFQSAGDTLLSLGFMWLSWVVVVAMLALALSKRASDPRLARWITVGALLATTLPWFGFATAEMMV